MKTNLPAVLAALALSFALRAPAETADVFDNQFVVIVPSLDNPSAPMVDARVFINEPGAVWSLTLSDLWRPVMTSTFTNKGYFSAGPGFWFRTYITGPGATPSDDVRAEAFVNQWGGGSNGVMVITGSTNYDSSLLYSNFFTLLGSARLIVDAKTIINDGIILMPHSSLARFEGEHIDLSSGTVYQSGPSELGFAAGMWTNLSPDALESHRLVHSGMLDYYWGMGVETNAAFYPATMQVGEVATSPADWVVDRNGKTYRKSLSLVSPLSFQQVSMDAASNILCQVVFLYNANDTINNQVMFVTNGVDDAIAVEWTWNSTNAGPGVVTNCLTLIDSMGLGTNGLSTNGTVGLYINGVSGFGYTLVPTNYMFYPGMDFATESAGSYSVATPSPPTALLTIQPISNLLYSAYQGTFSAAGILPSDIQNGSVTNMPGRIELRAEKDLNLTGANLKAGSYLGLQVPGQFLGAQGSTLLAPYVDLHLRSTNGTLAITNLLSPLIAYPDGTIGLWSGFWTNVVVDPLTTNSTTVRFHVLMVDTRFVPTSLPVLETLDVGVTNSDSGPSDMFVSDNLIVSRTLNIQSRSITLTTNGPDAVTPCGELHFTSSGIFWPSFTPGLQCFTNWGVFETRNRTYFGGSQSQSGYGSSGVDIPYRATVNHGMISNNGLFLFSRYFENNGTVNVGSGPFSLQQAAVADLRDGALLATNGSVSIFATYCYMSNALVQAGGTLTIGATNCLDDGSFSSGSADGLPITNAWFAGNGFQLRRLPSSSSLLATKLTATATTNLNVVCTWAGVDYGATARGFANNAALGYLVLDGQPRSRFTINPAQTSGNALYVDRLELRNATADNSSSSVGDWNGVFIAPGMKVYYGDAVVAGRSIAEKLNGRNSGRFVWVSNYNCGLFSSSLFRYPGGVSNRVNTALAQSSRINSWAGTGSPCDTGVPNALNIDGCGPVPPSMLNNCFTQPAVVPVAAPGLIDNLAFARNPFVAPSAMVGAAYHANISTSAATASRDILVFAKVDGPSWLVVAADGTLSGTPADSDAGINWFRVSATTMEGFSTSATMRLDVGAVADGITLDPPPAEFASGDLKNVKGSYFGLFTDTNGVTPLSSGYVSLYATASTYSGVLRLGGHNYSFTGTFDLAGLSQKTIRLSSTSSLDVQLRSSYGSDQIRGWVTGSSWRAELVADRLVFSRTHTNSFAGQYTMPIPPDVRSLGSPAGYGAGTVRVSSTGTLRWVANLADGTVISQSSALSRDGYWPLYAFQTTGKGMLISWMQFTNPVSAHAEGALVWSKSLAQKAKYYRGGFTNSVEAEVLRYSPPKSGTRALKWDSDSGRIVFSGGGLANDMTNLVSISAFNRVTASDKLVMTINSVSGSLQGSAVDPSTGKRFIFRGVLDQKRDAGRGFFLGPLFDGTGESGVMILSR